MIVSSLVVVLIHRTPEVNNLDFFHNFELVSGRLRSEIQAAVSACRCSRAMAIRSVSCLLTRLDVDVGYDIFQRGFSRSGIRLIVISLLMAALVQFRIRKRFSSL